jgi:hypothetical protein
MKKIANYDWSHLVEPRDNWRTGYTDSGGTRKIADAPPRPCQHPEHNPPGMCVFEPGVYEHICPGCRKKKIFTVSEIYL